MTDEERLAKGKEMFEKAYGDVVPFPEPLTPFSENSIKNLFGEIFARDRLSMRDRRLLILGALAGTGADPSLFEIHVRSALQNGEIEYDELEEFCLVLVNYCGYPRLAPLAVLCQKLVEESGPALED